VNPKWLFLLCTSLPVLWFFLLKSLQGKVEANWGATAYMTGLIFSIVWFFQWYDRKKETHQEQPVMLFGITALLLGMLLTGLTLNTGIIRKAGIHFPPAKDPTTRLYGWNFLGSEISLLQSSMPQPEKVFIFSEQYQMAAELAFYTHNQPRTYCINLGRRMNQYDLWPGMDNLTGWDAIYVTTGNPEKPDSEIIQSFAKMDGPIRIPIYKNDLLYHQYTAFRVYGYNGRKIGILSSGKY
jgi:undecaprenyl-diphosphatase